MESHGDVRVPVADCRCYMNVYGRGYVMWGYLRCLQVRANKERI